MRHAWLAICALAVGCGGPASSKLAAPVEVTGRVLAADGAPVARMIVTFHPQDEANAHTRDSGLLDADGKFRVSLAPGRYKATLAAVPGQLGGAEAKGGLASPGKSPNPKKARPLEHYRDAQTSPLAATVEAGKANDITLQLQ